MDANHSGELEIRSTLNTPLLTPKINIVELKIRTKKHIAVAG